MVLLCLRRSLAWVVLGMFVLGMSLGRFQIRSPSPQQGNIHCGVTSHQAASAWNTRQSLTHRDQSYPGLVDDALGDTFFNEIYRRAYSLAHPNNATAAGALSSTVRRDFDVRSWTHASSGGLSDDDRAFLGGIYRRATSVFEYGLGESTLIADHVGVPRYSGIDSDPVWLSDVRSKVSSHFRFYLGDIGETVKWGAPTQDLKKAVLNYQLAPLQAEPECFDVYLVDGRFRLACMMASFLHASARKCLNATVIVHDCHRKPYHRADHLLKLVGASGRLCAYTRLPNTTDERIHEVWTNHYDQG